MKYDLLELVVNQVWKLENEGRKVTVKAVARRLRRHTFDAVLVALVEAQLMGCVGVREDNTLYLG